MNFSRVFSRAYVRANMKFADRDEALREIARLVKKSPDAADVSEDEVYEAFKLRENLSSTGFGDEIAIPHCKLAKIKDFVTGIITVPDGVDFDAEDHRNIKVIVFLVGPESEVNEHIRLLAVIAQKLDSEDSVRRLLSAASTDELVAAFESSARVELPMCCSRGGHEMLNVIVQDEDWFNEILEILSGFEDSQVVVLDADFEGRYLVKLAFYSNIWTENSHDFCKMIVASVEKDHIGAIIQKIDTTVGGLKNCERVLVVVQPILYMAGSLQL